MIDETVIKMKCVGRIPFGKTHSLGKFASGDKI